MMALLPPHAAVMTTGAFFNPALAVATTFACTGSSLRDYVQVYWLGPLTGEMSWGQRVFFHICCKAEMLGATPAPPGKGLKFKGDR